MSRFKIEIDGNPSPFWKKLSLAAVTLVCGWLSFGEFLSGKSMFWHDSLAGFSLQHLTYERLIAGRLPLWVPELNAGQPLWPIVETVVSYDPVALLFWPLGALFGLPSMVIFEAVCIVWLLLFAWGGLLLSRRILNNWWLNLAVFALLFGGPVSWAMPAQWSYLCPFRYTPFVLLALIRLLDDPSRRNAVILGLAGALSTAGYQTNYAAWFVLVFAVFYVFARHKAEGKTFSGLEARRFLLAAGVCALGSLPLLVAGIKMLGMVAVPRLLSFGWTYPLETFLAGLLGIEVPTWQGSAYVGICASAVILLALAAALVSCVKKEGGACAGWSALELAWIFSTVVMGIFVLGLFGFEKYFEDYTFLGLRNWGLALTVLVLCLSQLFVVGAKRVDAFANPYVSVFYGLMLVSSAVVLGTSDPANFAKDWPILLLTAGAPVILFWLKRWAGASLCYVILGLACIANVALDSSFFYGSNGFARGKAFALVPAPRQPNLPDTREWMFDADANFPFVVDGPALIHTYYAVMPLQRNVLALDLFHLPRYHNFGTSRIPRDHMKIILGYTAPILRTVHKALPSGSETQSMALLAQLGDYTRLNTEAVAEGPLPEDFIKRGAAAPAGAIKLNEYAETGLSVSVDMPEDGLLVFSDNWDTGWTVRVDGAKAPLLKANVTNKAVFLRKGSRVVEFRYFPAAYVAVFWFRILFWLLACVWLAAPLFTARRLERSGKK